MSAASAASASASGWLSAQAHPGAIAVIPPGAMAS
jgi:hypothetical protein